jgi:hypothetical protein
VARRAVAQVRLTGSLSNRRHANGGGSRLHVDRSLRASPFRDRVGESRARAVGHAGRGAR